MKRMEAYLSAKDIKEDLKINSAYQYVKEVDPFFENELLKSDYSKVLHLLDEIISLEVAKYVLYHVGGDRPFDQLVGDTLGRMCYAKKEEFEALTGRTYISKNNDW
jgi:hypothetical protein